MIQEQGFIENAATEAPAKAPFLSDGIGLTLEQAKALIAQNSGVILSKSWASPSATPTLANYKSSMNGGTVRAWQSPLSVEGIRKVFDGHAATLHSFKNVAVLVLRGLRWSPAAWILQSMNTIPLSKRSFSWTSPVSRARFRP
jgi:hypothetical protein